MGIASSTVAAQWDRWVREEHVDTTGKRHTITYYSAVGADLQVELAAHATQLAADLAAQEIEEQLA